MIKIIISLIIISTVTNCNINRKKQEIFTNNYKSEISSVSGTYLAANFYISKGDAYKAREILNKNNYNPKLTKLKFFSNLVSGNFEVANKISISLATKFSKNNLYYFPQYIINIKKNKFKENFNLFKQSDLDKGLRNLSPLINLWLSNTQNKPSSIYNEGKYKKTIHELLILENFYEPKNLKNIANQIYETENLNNNDVLFLAGFYFRLNDFQRFEDIIQTKLSNQFDKELIIKSFSLNDNIFYKTPNLHTILASRLYNNSILNNQRNERSNFYQKILLEMSIYLCPNLDISKYSLAELYNLEKTNRLALKKLKSISSDSFFFLPSNLKTMSIIKSLNRENDYKNHLFNNLKIWPKNKYLLYKLASYFKSKKQYHESIKIYKEIMGIYGESDRDLFLYASNLDKIGKWEEAKALLLNMLKKNPKDTYALNYVSYKLALKEQDLKVALSFIKQALAIDPENGFFLDTLGWVEFKRKNYNKAVFFLEKSVSILPRSSEILDHLGDCYFMLNRKKEAVFEWKKAIKYETDTKIIKKIQAKLKKHE